jgi:hypothetical protein
VPSGDSRCNSARGQVAGIVLIGLATTALATLLARVVRGMDPPPSTRAAEGSARSDAAGKGRNGTTPAPHDIRRLSQHFIDPTGELSPWMFLPSENIKSLSTAEHPGMVTIWEAGRGQDVKGLLKEPIRINDYPLPWEFHLGIVQNFIALKGLSEKQINYAIGLNLALTFSDPSTWPKDRSRQPPDTHSTQLFVVHLGNIGENYQNRRGEGPCLQTWG